MSLRALLAALLIPALAHASDSLPCARGPEAALRGCLATHCDGSVKDATPPRVRDAGWRVLGCEPKPPSGSRTFHTGEYRLYRPDGHALELVTVIASYSRGPGSESTFTFDGGPLDVGDDHLFRLDTTQKQTSRTSKPARVGTDIILTTVATICPRERGATGACSGFTILRDETFAPADRRLSSLRMRETWRFEIKPGSIEAIGPLERQSPQPRDESVCRTGTLQEVVDCMQAHCAGNASDDAPEDLERAGWHVIECGFLSEQPVDRDLPIAPEGEARVYREQNGQLVFAATLTSLGHAAKYWMDTPFDVGSWRLQRIGPRKVLWLEWTISEPGRNADNTGELVTDTRYATVCIADGAGAGTCPATVPLRITTSETPFTGGRPVITEQRYDVTTDDAGLVISGPVGSPQTTVRHVPIGGAAGP